MLPLMQYFLNYSAFYMLASAVKFTSGLNVAPECFGFLSALIAYVLINTFSAC